MTARASLCPEGVAELGPEVWNPEGVKILEHLWVPKVRSGGHRETAEEQRLWNAVPTVRDLQAAWQILLQCAGPRCHHVLRTLPKSQSEVCARGHDLGMEQVHSQEIDMTKRWPTTSLLSMRMGGSWLEMGTQNGASSLLSTMG